MQDLENRLEYPMLAIDYGRKRVGLAISDSKGIIASPIAVLTNPKDNKIALIEAIKRIVNENRVKSLLVGMPQAFETEHEAIRTEILDFTINLEHNTGLRVHHIDESYSTKDAQNMLISSGQHTKKFKSRIDKVSAAIFLQRFLNLYNKSENEESL